MLKVACIDDQQITHDAFKKLFKRAEEDYAVQLVLSTTSPADFFSYLEEHGAKSIDVAIIDFRMPEMNGEEVLKEMKRKYTSVKCVIYTNYYSEMFAEAMLEKGADGCFDKNVLYSELIESLIYVHENGYYLPNDFSDEKLKEFAISKKIKTTYDYTAVLNEREKEIALLTAKGFSSTEIGDKLCISRRTVEGHKESLYKKTNCNRAAGIAIYCFCRGWL